MTASEWKGGGLHGEAALRAKHLPVRPPHCGGQQGALGKLGLLQERKPCPGMSPWVVSLPCIPSALEAALGDRSHTQLMAVLSCLTSSGTALLGSCGHPSGVSCPKPSLEPGLVSADCSSSRVEGVFLPAVRMLLPVAL